jgi:hypothetical protein
MNEDQVFTVAEELLSCGVPMDVVLSSFARAGVHLSKPSFVLQSQTFTDERAGFLETNYPQLAQSSNSSPPAYLIDSPASIVDPFPSRNPTTVKPQAYGDPNQSFEVTDHYLRHRHRRPSPVSHLLPHPETKVFRLEYSVKFVTVN